MFIPVAVGVGATLLGTVAGSSLGGGGNDESIHNTHKFAPQTEFASSAQYEQKPVTNVSPNAASNLSQTPNQSLLQAPNITFSPQIIFNGENGTVFTNLETNGKNAQTPTQMTSQTPTQATKMPDSFTTSKKSGKKTKADENQAPIGMQKLLDKIPHPEITPWKAVAALTGGSFCYIFYTLRSAEYMFRQKKQWCNWNDHISTQELAQATHEELAPHLVMDIQKQYTTSKHVHNFVEPLKSFMADIEREEAQITWYLSLSRFVQKIFLGKVFGITTAAQEQAQDSLERLKILKKIFVAWSAEFKFGRRASAAPEKGSGLFANS